MSSVRRRRRRLRRYFLLITIYCYRINIEKSEPIMFYDLRRTWSYSRIYCEHFILFTLFQIHRFMFIFCW